MILRLLFAACTLSLFFVSAVGLTKPITGTVEFTSDADPRHGILVGPAFRARDLRAWLWEIRCRNMAARYDSLHNAVGRFCSDFPENDETYAYVGVHHAAIDNTDPAMSLDTTLRSFVANGLRTEEYLREGRGLYGPGAYLTHRPEIATHATARRVCPRLNAAVKDPRTKAPRKIGIIAFHVFVPTKQLKTWTIQPAQAVRNGFYRDAQGKDHDSMGSAAEKIWLQLSKLRRRDWGISDSTAVIAVKDLVRRRRFGIDEMTWGPGMGRQAKFIGEMVDPTALRKYCAWVASGAAERAVKDPRAIKDQKVIANFGVPEVMRIPNTQVFEALKHAIFDMQFLPRQAQSHPLWAAYSQGRRRDY